MLAQLITAERNVEAAQRAVDSAREGVRIAVGRYQAALDLARSRLRHSVAEPFGEGYAEPARPPVQVR